MERYRITIKKDMAPNAIDKIIAIVEASSYETAITFAKRHAKEIGGYVSNLMISP